MTRDQRWILALTLLLMFFGSLLIVWDERMTAPKCPGIGCDHVLCIEQRRVLEALEQAEQERDRLWQALYRIAVYDGSQHADGDFIAEAMQNIADAAIATKGTR